MATPFEHGVDFGLIVHKSPFMADEKNPLVLSDYIFMMLEVDPGVAGFLIQLHPEDVDVVMKTVTAHAEKGAATKTTLYGGREEAEEVEQGVDEVEELRAGRGRGKPHNTFMISVQKVRIRPGKGKGMSDGWFPRPLIHNTRRFCTGDPKNKLPMHSPCPTREWERVRVLPALVPTVNAVELSLIGDTDFTLSPIVAQKMVCRQTTMVHPRIAQVSLPALSQSGFDGWCEPHGKTVWL